MLSLKVLTFGENKQTRVTLADRLMVTDMLVILRATWFAVPKYRGTKASHITQVVYIVNPVTAKGELAAGLCNLNTGFTGNANIMDDNCRAHYLLSRSYRSVPLDLDTKKRRYRTGPFRNKARRAFVSLLLEN